jgi:hypothetical protein
VPDDAITPTSQNHFVHGLLAVFAAEHEGFLYRAYHVKRRGHDVIVSDPHATSRYAKGDSMLFWASRSETQDLNDQEKPVASLTFEVLHRPDRAEHNAAGAAASPNQLQPNAPLANGMHEDKTSEVQTVFSAEHEGLRYRSYLVKWRGQDVIASDISATSKYSNGDTITFMAQCNDHQLSRNQDERRKELVFRITTRLEPIPEPLLLSCRCKHRRSGAWPRN